MPWKNTINTILLSILILCSLLVCKTTKIVKKHWKHNKLDTFLDSVVFPESAWIWLAKRAILLDSASLGSQRAFLGVALASHQLEYGWPSVLPRSIQHLWAPKGLSLGSLWLPFGSLGMPVGSFMLPWGDLGSKMDALFCKHLERFQFLRIRSDFADAVLLDSAWICLAKRAILLN